MSAESLTSIRRLTRFSLRTVNRFAPHEKKNACRLLLLPHLAPQQILVMVVSVVMNPSAPFCVLVRCEKTLFFDQPHISKLESPSPSNRPSHAWLAHFRHSILGVLQVMVDVNVFCIGELHNSSVWESSWWVAIRGVLSVIVTDLNGEWGYRL